MRISSDLNVVNAISSKFGQDPGMIKAWTAVKAKFKSPVVSVGSSLGILPWLTRNQPCCSPSLPIVAAMTRVRSTSLLSANRTITSCNVAMTRSVKVAARAMAESKSETGK